MRNLAWLIAGLLVTPIGLSGQDPTPGKERILLLTREEITGELQPFRAPAPFIVRTGKTNRSVRIEEVSHIAFDHLSPTRLHPVGGLRLQNGGVITAKELTFEGHSFLIRAEYGTFTVAREHVKSVLFAALDANVPELKEEREDIFLWRKTDEDKELSVAYGKLHAMTASTVVLDDGRGTSIEVPRDRARTLHLSCKEGTRSETYTGWFAKLLLRNGDRFLGVLRSLDGERAVLFSRELGEVTLAKAALHSITFVQHPRASVGNILICEQNSVRELDRSGKELWRYRSNLQNPWAARKLENGNVLIANTNNNQVLEIKPTDREGGEVVWQLDEVNYPYDARRLPNGNTLVAEYYARRVAEYDAQGKSVVWQATDCDYPISAQRLENGHTLICAARQVVEIDLKLQEKWRASLNGIQAWRAERLETGTTLIVDQQRGSVVEIDAQNHEVWRKDGLARPMAAVRLDDGNTLIVEQRTGQIVEVDPTGKQVHAITNLSYPIHISTY